MPVTWLDSKTSSILIDTTVKITGISVSVNVVEMTYGPLHVSITTNEKFSGDIMDQHPFMYAPAHLITDGNRFCEILENTPAVRAILEELANPAPLNLYTTTQMCHTARLIKSLANFWS